MTEKKKIETFNEFNWDMKELENKIRELERRIIALENKNAVYGPSDSNPPIKRTFFTKWY